MLSVLTNPDWRSSFQDGLEARNGFFVLLWVHQVNSRNLKICVCNSVTDRATEPSNRLWIVLLVTENCSNVGGWQASATAIVICLLVPIHRSCTVWPDSDP